MRITLIILCAQLLGCLEYNGHFIDTRCTDREQQIILTAVDKINDALGYDAVIIEGVKTFGLGQMFDRDDYDIIYCVDDLEGKYSKNHAGYFAGGDIGLSRTDNDIYYLRLAMHELGHYAGMSHVVDDGSVMYPRWPEDTVTEYTQIDVESIGR